MRTLFPSRLCYTNNLTMTHASPCAIERTSSTIYRLACNVKSPRGAVHIRPQSGQHLCSVQPYEAIPICTCKACSEFASSPQARNQRGLCGHGSDVATDGGAHRTIRSSTLRRPQAPCLPL